MKYSPSRHKKLKTCDRLYYFHYIENWRETKVKPWLKIGTSVDDLLALYDISGLDAVLKELPKHFPDPYDQIDYTHIFKHYHKKFSKEPLPPLTVEGQPGNQWYGKTKINPEYVDSDIEVEGYLDKVVESNGHPAVLERKTTADPINWTSAYWKPLKQDKQIISYTYLLGEISGCSANRVFYEVIRKPSKSVSALFGRTHVVKKVETKWTLEEYEKRVESLFATTLKQEIVARRKLWITDDMRSEWMADLVADDDHLKNMMENAKVYEANDMNPMIAYPRNQNGCSAFGGCPFREFCDGKKELNDIDLICKKQK